MPRLSASCYASDRCPAQLDIVALNASPGDVSIQLSGELDVFTSAALAVELTRHLRRNVTVDLKALTFMDCAGFTTLADFAAQLRQHGSSLRCTNAQGPVKRLFELLAADPCDRSARHARARAAALRTRRDRHDGRRGADARRRRPDHAVGR